MTEAEAEAAETEDALKADIADTEDIEASEIDCAGLEDVMSTFGATEHVELLESDELVIANPLDKAEEAGLVRREAADWFALTLNVVITLFIMVSGTHAPYDQPLSEVWGGSSMSVVVVAVDIEVVK